MSGDRSRYDRSPVTACPVMRNPRVGSANAPESATRGRPATLRVMLSNETFGLFVDVVAACSRRENRFKAARQVVIHGLDLIIRSSTVDRFYALKTYVYERHRGPIAQLFQFDGDEKRLVQETRALLEEHSGIKVSTHDVIVLAVLAAARASGVTK